MEHQSPRSASLSPPPRKVEPLPLFLSTTDFTKCFWNNPHIKVSSYVLSPQQLSPYMPSPISSPPVASPPAAPMSSMTSFPPPYPPGPIACAPPPSAANMSSSSPAAPSFSVAPLSFPANPGPVSVSTFPYAPHVAPGPVCTMAAPSHSSASVAHVSFNSSTDSPMRFTFDELNLPDLYASFKSLVRTMRERGGSQCECDLCVLWCINHTLHTYKQFGWITYFSLFSPADVAPLTFPNNDTTPLHTPTLLPLSPHPAPAPPAPPAAPAVPLAHPPSQYSESHRCLNRVKTITYTRIHIHCFLKLPSCLPPQWCHLIGSAAQILWRRASASPAVWTGRTSTCRVTQVCAACWFGFDLLEKPDVRSLMLTLSGRPFIGFDLDR